MTSTVKNWAYKDHEAWLFLSRNSRPMWETGKYTLQSTLGKVIKKLAMQRGK